MNTWGFATRSPPFITHATRLILSPITNINNLLNSKNVCKVYRKPRIMGGDLFG